MRTITISRTRTSLLASTVAAGLLALGLAGCNSGSALPAPDAKRAAVALQAGLDAQTTGKLDAARQKYEEALTYDPKNKFALYDLALVDQAQANYGVASDRYRAALAVDPAYEPALFNLAILRKQAGDTAEAISLYQRVLQANPKNAAAQLNLGLLLRATHQKAAGDAAIAAAIKLNPQLKDPAAKTSAS